MRQSDGRVPLGIMVAAILASFAGCAERPPAKQDASLKEFVFITNGDSPFWDAAEKGWKETIGKLGRQNQFLRNKSGDAAGQIRLLDQVASRSNVAGVAISIVDASATGITDRLRELNKRIPVVTVDSDCKPEDQEVRRAYVGTNNQLAGEVAGRVAKLLLPDGGKWIGFVGSSDADNARDRIAGFIKAAGDGFTEIDVMQDQHDHAKSRENVRASLNKGAQLMFGIYSYEAPAIAEVVAEAGKRDKLKIVTFDAEENTVREIEKGHIDATIVQNTFDMGAESAILLNAFTEKDESLLKEKLGDGTVLDTSVRVIVPDDSKLDDPDVQKVSEFKEYMEMMNLRST